MIYDLIQYENPAVFKTAVQERLDDGWELAGGVSVCCEQIKAGEFTLLKFTYTQAIYLDDEAIRPASKDFGAC